MKIHILNGGRKTVKYSELKVGDIFEDQTVSHRPILRKVSENMAETCDPLYIDTHHDRVGYPQWLMYTGDRVRFIGDDKKTVIPFNKVKEAESFEFNGVKATKINGLGILNLQKEDVCLVERKLKFEDLKVGQLFTRDDGVGNIYMKTKGGGAVVVKPAYPIDTGYCLNPSDCKEALRAITVVDKKVDIV